MEKKDLKKLFSMSLNKVKPGNTISIGEVLEFLTECAKNSNIEDIAKCCRWYFEYYPRARKYITNRIPVILYNHYFLYRKDLAIEKFFPWAQRNGNWSKRIKTNVCKPIKLNNEVERIVSLVNSYRGPC